MNMERIERETLLTSAEVGSLLQVNPSSVNKWVEEGHIRAFKTPGGHRRIRADDLVAFLDSHKMPVPRMLAPIAKRRLLAVDDDPTQLKSLQRALKKYSGRIETHFVNNGIDALVLVGSFKPHLIVLDMYMPEIDGIEVCKRLKANPETSHINVIITSGQLKNDVIEQGLKAGAIQCVQKPIDLEVILRALDIDEQPVATRS